MARATVDTEQLRKALHDKWTEAVDQARQANDRARQAVHGMNAVTFGTVQYRYASEQGWAAQRDELRATAKADGLREAIRVLDELTR